MPLIKNCQKCGCMLGMVNKSKQFCMDCRRKKYLETQAAYRQTQAYRDSLSKYRLSEKHKSISKIYGQREDVKERIRKRRLEYRKDKYTFKLCKQCGNTQIVYPDKHQYCESCNYQRQLAHQDTYHRTDKWKAVSMRYRNSIKGKATRAAYNKSEKERATVARFRNGKKWLVLQERRKAKRQRNIAQEIRNNVILERAV